LLFLPSDVSLRELYNSSPHKSVKWLAEPGQEETAVISMTTPDRRTTFEISISPKHNYAISKVMTKSSGIREKGFPPKHSLEKVVEFYDYDFGLSIPKLVHVSSETEPDVTSERRVLVESINTPIPSADLDLEFLPGTRVNDFLNNAYYVWGDGKPDKTFQTGKALVDWVTRQDQAMARVQNGRLSYGSFLVLSVLTIVLSILVIIRSKLAKRVASNPM
jgi:hypothetical protein